jgi:hypothetical protein
VAKRGALVEKRGVLVDMFFTIINDLDANRAEIHGF